MEEVDKIIIVSLRTIGCDIEDEIASLKEFSTELIVSSAVKCIKTILKQDVDLPNTLPGGMSARFRMGTGLANYIQELGYKEEIGYQTFLYSNESEIRKVFMFLVDRLSKDTVETTEEPMDDIFVVDRGFRDSLDYLEQMGIKAKMPSFLSKGDKQMSTENANTSRLVTKIPCRGRLQHPSPQRGARPSSCKTTESSCVIKILPIVVTVW